MKTTLLLYLSVLIICINCTNTTEIENAYTIAKENKKELQTVIEHFSSSPKDSLKLEAAKYLIKQMCYNYSTHTYKSPSSKEKKRFNTIHQMSNKIITGDSLIPIKTLKSLMDSLKTSYTNPDNPKQSKTLLIDAQQILSSDLINHINNRFSVWNNSSFCKDLSKSEFFETILPFRARHEPLDLHTNYTQKYFDFFNKDTTITNTKGVNIKLNNYLKCFTFSKKGDIPHTHKGLYSILEVWGKECIDKTTHTTKILRSAGIPTYIEFTPQWSNRIANRRHFWCSIKDRDKGYQLFSPPHEVIGDSTTNKYKENASKIYRYKGITNLKSPYFTRARKEYIPGIFNTPYIFDITNHHFNTTSIKVPINKHNSNANLCYLATFNAPNWMPIAYTTLKTNEVTFNNIRSHHIYAVIHYPNNKDIAEPITEPFFVNGDGTINFIKPKAANKHLRLFQKYQQKEEISQFVEMVIGAKIQVANQPDFSDSVTLYTVLKFPKPITYSIPLHTEKKYRYARIISNKKHKSLNITHIEFHASSPVDTLTTLGVKPSILTNISKDSLAKLHQPTKLKGEVYSSIKKWMSEPMKLDRLKACDGNYNTYTRSSEISFDFGRPINISSVRYTPRHADNWIISGQHYTLLYYDKGWLITDTIQAKNNYLDFHSVPSNTIYWLRNIDTGREEQAFIYSNNKQIFINTIDFKRHTKSPFQ